MFLFFTDDGNDSLATDKDRAGAGAGSGVETTEQTSREGTSGYQSQEENLRRDAERLQALINGNTLGPRTTTPPRPPARASNVQFNTDDDANTSGEAGNGRDREKDKRDRRPTVDLEEESYRRGRKEQRDKERLLRRSRSESARGSGTTQLSPWSALGRSGRPDGYTREQVNALGVAGAIALKGWEREEDRHREALIAKPGEFRVGRRN